MSSPFPGMDPYLESPDVWPDFHLTMTVAMRAALVPLLPEHYSASVDRYVWIHEPEAEKRSVLGKPDVHIAASPAKASAAGAAMALAPVTVQLPVERREGEPFLKITDRRNRRVGSVIELLSPANKNPNEDRDAYLAKRNDYLATRVNLVEIDLLRAGPRMPLGEPAPARADYYVLISSASEFPIAGYWPFSVRDPLPDVPIPLADQDPPILLSLRTCLSAAQDLSD